MINHARTLLLNVSGSGSGYAARPGAEFVPPDFRAVQLNSFLLAIYETLFGTSADNTFLNYRVRELMGLLHVTELVEFVTELDPRITYEVLPPDQLFDSLFDVKTTPLDGTTAQLFIQGKLADDDNISRVEEQWTVRVTSGVTAEVTRHAAPIQQSNEPYTITSGLSSDVPLIGSDLSVKFAAGIGSEWYIETATRPGTDLGSILANIDAITEDVKLELFGVGSSRGATEPFKTFHNLYKEHPEMPYRLGGIMLAFIYQVDQLRKLSGT